MPLFHTFPIKNHSKPVKKQEKSDGFSHFCYVLSEIRFFMAQFLAEKCIFAVLYDNIINHDRNYIPSLFGMQRGVHR